MSAVIEPSQAEALLRKAESHVKEAMAHVPAEKRRCYEEACDKCPDLVQRESHAIVFLRCTDYNPYSAADRLCQYWNDRCRFFQDRAFLPMTQTGDGALSADDLVALHAGFFVFLPPSTTTGKDVVFVDRTKSLQQASREARLRCLFYLFQVLSEKEESQMRGIMLIVLLIQPRVVDIDPEFVRNATRMLKHTFPAKVHIHMINCPPKSGKRDLVQSVLQRTLSCVMENLTDGEDYDVHMEESKAQLKSLLASMGVLQTPSSTGGTWKYEEFTKWCRQRATQERVSYRSRSTAHAAPNLPEDSLEDTKPPALTTEDKNERKRLVNVIHSRQKRERRKSEQKLLEQEAEVLETKKRRLLEEQSRLKNLLSTARTIESALQLPSHNYAAPAFPGVGATAAFLPATSPHVAGTMSLPSPNPQRNLQLTFQETPSLFTQHPTNEQDALLALLLQSNPDLTVAGNLGSRSQSLHNPTPNQNICLDQTSTQLRPPTLPPTLPQATSQHPALPVNLQPQSVRELLLRAAVLNQQQQQPQQQPQELGWLLQQQQQTQAAHPPTTSPLLGQQSQQQLVLELLALSRR